MFQTNRAVAGQFRAMADLLAAHRENPYRVRAYRRAAESLLNLQEDVAHIARRGGLEEIPGIGEDLAGKITEYLSTGNIRALEELKEPLRPEVADWTTLPGLSESLVYYLTARLGIRSLADLETLAQSHLLRTLPGFSATEAELLAAIRARRQGEASA